MALENTGRRKPGVMARVLAAIACTGYLASAPSVADDYSLQELFNVPSGTIAFAQDGMEFFNFTPALTNDITKADLGDWVTWLFSPDRAITNAPLFDTTGTGIFSYGWKQLGGIAGTWYPLPDDLAANPSNVGVVKLEDDGDTEGIDPGFRLIGNDEFIADAGASTPGNDGDDVATGQLSAFVYDVKIAEDAEDAFSSPIHSADLALDAMIDAVGPDVLTESETPPPLFTDVTDFAGAFVLQFVLDPQLNDAIIDINATGLVEFNEDPTLTLLVSGIGALLGVDLEVLLALERPYDHASFDGYFDDKRDTLRILNVMGLLATSEGMVSVNEIAQRIDPPAPDPAPAPATLALLGIGLAGIGYQRRLRQRIALPR
jgi:hypothetical protein